MSREEVFSPFLLFILCLSLLIYTHKVIVMTAALHGDILFSNITCIVIWFTLNHAFIVHVNASLFLSVMHCWLQPDAINSVSLALKEIVNRDSYSGKQLKNSTPENS